MNAASRAAVALLAASSVHASDFTLDDLAFWVGEGPNEVGVAIDWNGDDLPLEVAAPSLAWGFRWDGGATAEDALLALLAADPRLFGKLDTGEPDDPADTIVLGLGYDANDDGDFAIEIDPALMVEFAESFDPTTGLADNQFETFASSVDPEDAYDEGFNFNLANPDNDGFWHLATTDGPAAAGFASSNFGVSLTALVPDTFLSLAFTPSFDFTAFANNVAAAEPPSVAPTPGDFNGDGFVDALDYLALRDTAIDAASFALFVDNFGSGTAAINAVAFAVPEPHAALLLLLGFSGSRRRRHPLFTSPATS